jgi:hypothetical protein
LAPANALSSTNLRLSRRAYGASPRARTAINAGIRINHKLSVTFGYGTYGARRLTSATANAFVSNLKCHYTTSYISTGALQPLIAPILTLKRFPRKCFLLGRAPCKLDRLRTAERPSIHLEIARSSGREAAEKRDAKCGG